MVIAVVGAGGKTYFTLASLGFISGNMSSRDDQPAGVSPRPCKKMSAAGPLLHCVERAAVPSLLAMIDIVSTRMKMVLVIIRYLRCLLLSEMPMKEVVDDESIDRSLRRR